MQRTSPVNMRIGFTVTVILLLVSHQSTAALSFTDITAALGINVPDSHLHEIRGGHSAVWADVNNDYRADLYITMLIGSSDTDAFVMADLFFQNVGNEDFREKAQQRGIDDVDNGNHGATWADLDNDGDYDLFTGTTIPAGENPAYPFHNNVFANDGSGYFTDVTPNSMRAVQMPTRATLAFDWDNDGDLDLLGVEGWLGTRDKPSAMTVPPHVIFNEAYANQGNLQFVRITQGDLVDAPLAQGATDTDFDGDGDIDILGANRTGKFNVLVNDGSGYFQLLEPADIGVNNRHKAKDGITTADVDNDGDLDLLLASAGRGKANTENLDRLYLNRGDGTFTFAQSFFQGHRRLDGYMGGFADLDNDGDVDLVFAGDDTCYLNDGTGYFIPGPAIRLDTNAGQVKDPRAIAFADIDNDGDVDFALSYKRSTNRIIRNNNTNGNNWLNIALIAPNGQAGAFGAKTRIYKANKAGNNAALLGLRESKSNYGWLGQDDPVLHFGLGKRKAVDVVVTFLDGTLVTRTNVSANQTIVVDGSAPLEIVWVSSNQPDHTVWHTINFSQPFHQPIVVMGLPTANGGDPTTLWVPNVSNMGFAFQLDEWEYRSTPANTNGSHAWEDVPYLVIEEGTHIIGGSKVEAKTIPAVNDQEQVVHFTPHFFTRPPVVLSQIVTRHGNQAAVTRMHDITPRSFVIRLQEEEGSADGGIHADEIVHYIAFEFPWDQP